MPLYEYRCRACEERFEVLQPLGADGSHRVCPRCAEPGPARVHSTFAAQMSTSPMSTSQRGGSRDAAAAAAACCRGPGFS